MRKYKPNLDRIEYALWSFENTIENQKIMNRTEAVREGYKNIFKDRTEYLFQKWEAIENGKISYEVKDNIELKEIIKEHQLEEFQNDILFLAFCFFEDISIILKREEKAIERKKGLEHRIDFSELISPLEFFLNFNSNEIMIEIKHRKIKKTIKIYDKNITHVSR